MLQSIVFGRSGAALPAVQEVGRSLALLLLAVLLGSLAGLLRAGPSVAEASPLSGSSGQPEYALSDIHYTPQSANPAALESIEFHLCVGSARPPESVRVRMGGEDASWYPCRLVSLGPQWTCHTPGVSLGSIEALTVSAR